MEFSGRSLWQAVVRVVSRWAENAKVQEIHAAKGSFINKLLYLDTGRHRLAKGWRLYLSKPGPLAEDWQMFELLTVLCCALTIKAGRYLIGIRHEVVALGTSPFSPMTSVTMPNMHMLAST